MKLGTLRDHLAYYEKHWSLRRAVLGERNAAIALRAYLLNYDTKSDDYVLKTRDIFTLLMILPLESKVALVNKIKQELNQDYWIDVYQLLKTSGTFNGSENLRKIYNLTVADSHQLHLLFGENEPDSLPPVKEVIEVALDIVTYKKTNASAMVACFKLLNKKSQLTKDGLLLVKEFADDSDTILQTLKNLQNAGCLKDSVLSKLRELPIVACEVLNAVNNQNEFKALVEKLCEKQNFAALLRILQILKQFGDTYFSCDPLTSERSRNSESQNTTFNLLSLLQRLRIADQTSKKDLSNTAESENNVIFLSQISEFSLDDQVISQIINPKFNFEELYSILNYLAKSGLLTKDILLTCIERAGNPNLKEYSHDLACLLDILTVAKIKISKQELNQWLNSSSTFMNRLTELTFNLKQAGLLSYASLQLANQRITDRAPKPNISSAVKISRHDSKQARSEVILDDSLHFFTEHGSNSQTGSYGKVKPCYDSVDGTLPRFALKKLIARCKTESDDKQAMREVKYNRLLGRQAYCYSHQQKMRILADWQQQGCVQDVGAEDLEKASYQDRLKCLRYLITEINTLHKRYRVHGDIKPKNCILDLKNCTLKLIDFGSSHKKGSNKFFTWTPAFNNPYTSESFARDLYAFGFLVMYMYPEIFSLSLSDQGWHLKVLPNTPSIEQQAVINLALLLIDKDPTKYCSSETVLNYCDALLHMTKLDASGLKKVSDETIYRKASTVEDVLRGLKVSPRAC